MAAILYLRQTLAVAGKDLRAELRSKETINASLSFALVILLLFSFAFDPGAETVRDISGGLLWLVFAFAGALILNRSFARELMNDCLDSLSRFAHQRRASSSLASASRISSC